MASFWSDPAVRAVMTQKRVIAEPRLHSRISKARVAAVHPLEMSAALSALATAAHSHGLTASTQSSYSSHVNYFLEFSLSLSVDHNQFGAPEHSGGLTEEDESRVRSSCARTPRC